MRICFASNNPNKVAEIQRQIGREHEIKSLSDIGCLEEIIEDGVTLEENSDIKARFVLDTFSIDCFADDTGLEVEALNGAPGVYSARYAGEPSSSERNIVKLLQELKGSTNRKARFRTVITLLLGTEKHTFEGIANGIITEELNGYDGFGYDPVFIPEGHEKTFAQMSMEEKNKISHRGLAVAKLVLFLKNYSDR
jgi:XTP/dITP diphosphohydrolase